MEEVLDPAEVVQLPQSEEITSHRILQPTYHKAKPVIWADLTVNETDILLSTDNTNEIRSYLGRIFSLDDESNLKNKILLDLYFYTISFCKENHYSKEQTSAFFSIVKKTHEVAIETPFGNLDETFSYFKDLVLCHSVHRPPFSLGLFFSEQVSGILNYVIDTYFRHFKLYKYVFTPEVRLDLSISYAGMPMTPPPEISEPEIAVEEPVEEVENEVNPVASNEDKEVTNDMPTEEQEESEAIKQLKEIIRSHLSKELKEMKLSIESTIKSSEDAINQQISNAESGKKSANPSARGRKK